MGYVAHMVDMKRAYTVSVAKSGRKHHLGDLGINVRIILMDLKETGYEGVDWIHQAQDGWGPMVCSCEPSGSIKGGEFLDYIATISFSRRTLFHDVLFYTRY
jgi:hypothetical protein